MLRLVGLLAVAAQVALALPSCEAEVEANCLGEDADMSPEGITACLGALAEPSADCKTYLAMMTACEADLAPDAICGAAKMDGEAMPCLLQRTKPEDLTEACRAALPVEEKRGLAKFWADGKRQLSINEISELNKDDKEDYNRWQKRKKGKKTEKDRERDYAVKAAKRDRVRNLISAAVVAAKPATVKEAVSVAEAEASKAMEEDMTGTLTAFSKAELEKLAKAAFKEAKSEL